MLVLAAVFLAWFTFPGYVEKNLPRLVARQSEGQYLLRIENVEQQLFPFALRFSDVRLIPQKNVSGEAHGQTTLAFHAREIKVEGLDIKFLFEKNTFSARKIVITRPDIRFSGENIFQNDSAQLAGKAIAAIQPVFSRGLREIKIGQIDFVDANFGLYANAGDPELISGADHVSLTIKEFRTNPALLSRQSRPFETGDVLVKILNSRNDMGDSLHVMTIDTLEYSLKTTDIRAAGFHLYPRFHTKKKNLYRVTVPEVYVRGKSIASFALEDSLKISYLEFDNPTIRFYRKENPGKLKLEDFNDFDLYTLVQNHFSKMEVDSFFLAGARLEIFRQPDTVNYQQKFESVNIVLNGFALDSTSAQNRQKLLHSDDIEMQVNDYHLRMQENSHAFRADSLFVSTFSERLGAKKIYITPESSAALKNRTELDITCQALNIEEVDLRNLYHTRTLPTSKIEILAPVVRLQNHTGREKPAQEEEAGLLFDLVSDYLLGVYSNLVIIENGKLSIQNRQNQKVQGYFETSFNFSLTDFSLDSTSTQRSDKFFFATNFDLQFSDYRMRLADDLHKLTMKKASVSGMEQKVQIENLRLDPVTNNISFNTLQNHRRSELYHIAIPQIHLQGVNLKKAFFDKELKINDFKILHPDIHFENFGSLRHNREKIDFSEFFKLIFNYIHDFDIQHFSVPSGKLTWVNHTREGKVLSFDNAFSASLGNFRLNKAELEKKRLFFSDNFNVTIKDQQFTLSDSVHVLKAASIGLSSSDASVTIKNALLYPLITSGKYKDLPTTYQVSIPELRISDFDFRKAWHSRKPTIRKLEVVSPRFQVYNQKGDAQSLNLNNYKFPLPSFVKTLRINDFSIIDGEMITYQREENKHRAMARFNFNFNMPGVVMQNNKNNQIHISSRNMILNISRFKAPLGKVHTFAAGNISYDRKQQTISVDSLQVAPFFEGSNGNIFRIFTPSVDFTGFDLNTALNENKFAFSSINIQDPSVAIEVNQEIREDTLDFLKNLDLYPYTRPYLDEIRVDNLRLQNADLNLNWLQKELFKNKINLNFKNILITKNQPPSNLLNSEAFEISTTNLRTTSSDNLYEYSAGALRYNSARHRVLLSDIRIRPLLEKQEFPIQKGFQTDVVNARIDFFEIGGIDEKKWLKTNILDASVLRIGPADLQIFRNKRYPFNPDQRPPWPQDLIKNIRQPFVFDSLQLLPSRIRYSELTSLSDQPGYVEFNDLAFSGSCLSNIEEIYRQHKYFTVDARTRLYNQSLLQARFRFDLTAPDYAHTAKGSLRPMPLSPVNNMLEKAEPMSVEAGKLNHFEFDLRLNADRSTGLLYLEYNDLNIAVMAYKREGWQKNGLASFWANHMILNKQTPDKKDPVPVSIAYERDKKRSIINFWWKSIYSGTKKVLGIPEKK